MNTQERQYLFREKRAEGKSEMKANAEIMDLIQAQRLFKKMKVEIKSLVNEIKKLEKENSKLKEKVKQEKNQRMLDRLKYQKDVPMVQVESKSNGNHKVPTIHHINRILNFTELGKTYTKSDLAKELRIPSTLIEVALNFINRTTTSKFEKGNDCKWIRTQ
jgi:regulator of replication initiation timing